MHIIKLFLTRPIFASVFSIFILIIGIVSFSNLQVNYLPSYVKHNIMVFTSLPSADAQTVAKIITTPLEQVLKNVPGVTQITSTSSRGTSNIKLEFDNISETNFLTAISDINQKISSRKALFPTNINPQVWYRSDTDLVLFVSFSSSSTSIDSIDNIINNQISTKINQIYNAQTFSVTNMMGGNTNGLIIELKPYQLQAYKITPEQIQNTLSNYFKNYSSGQIKTPTQTIDLQLDLTPNSIQAIKNIKITTNSGRSVPLSTLATVSIKAPNDTSGFFYNNGTPSSMLGVASTGNGNPIKIAKQTIKTINNLMPLFPENVNKHIVYNKTTALQAAINEIIWTMIEAIICVALITYLFLASVRSALIPLITVPICLLGTGFILYLLGFTINLITLLALVLAVGLVVDDSIVILENTERFLVKEKNKLKATYLATKQVSIAIIAMTLCLICVYLPTGFLPGKTAYYFRVFAYTLASAIAFSALISFTLSPMMCRYLLHIPQDENKRKNLPYFVNKLFLKLKHLLTTSLRWFINYRKISLIIFLIIASSCLFLATKLPHELMPFEPSQYITYGQNFPDGTEPDIIKKESLTLANKIQKLDGVKNVFTASPNGSSVFGFIKTKFTNAKPLYALNTKINALLSQSPLFLGYSFLDNTNASHERMDASSLDNTVNFTLSSLANLDKLEQAKKNLINTLKQSPAIDINNASLNAAELTKQLSININTQLAQKLQVPLSNIIQKFTSIYNNTTPEPTPYTIGTSSYNVYLTYPLKSRRNFSILNKLSVKNINGKELPLSQFISETPSTAPPSIQHVNSMNALNITVNTKNGYVLGDAVQEIKQAMAKTFPSGGYQLDFSGAAAKLGESSHTILWVFVLGLVFVYLILAALFENITDPFIVLFTVPGCIAGAVLTMYFMGFSLNIITGLALITLIGLITKHGVLIIQFANQKRLEGLSKTQAVIEATAIRLRPIIMTTLTMVLGLLPLIIHQGLGSATRTPLGWIIIIGLIIGTVFAVYIVPIAYVLLGRKTVKKVELIHE